MTELAHILIVDDDPSSRRMFQLLLGDTGYRVSVASSGEEALAYLDLVIPDLLLMDLALPGISGQDVARRLKTDATKPFIPVLLITSHNDQKSKVMSLDAGADDILVKPVEFPELLARVRALLRLQRSQRSLRAEQRKTELLLHLTRELGATLDLDSLLTHFLDRLADAIGAVRASIILTTTPPSLYSSNRHRSMTSLSEILRDGVAGWVVRERRPVVIVDTRQDERWIAPLPHQQVVRSVAALPIVREDQTLGVITLVHHTPGYFTEEHLELLDSVAAQSAIALKNAELFQLTQRQKELLERRAEELQRINQISHHLTELMRPEQLLRLISHLIHHIFGYPIVSIVLRDGNDLVVRAITGHADIDRALGARYPQDYGVIGWVIAHQQPLTIPSVVDDPRARVLMGSEQVCSQLAVPILTGREVFGALIVESVVPAAFESSDITLLSTLAGQLGVALENAQLFDTEQRRVRQLVRVNDLSVAITAQLDSPEDLRIAADAVAAIFGVEHCGIVLFEGERRSALRIAAHTTSALSPDGVLLFPLPLRQIAMALELRAPLLISDVAHDERLRSLQGLMEHSRVTALAVTPLLSGGHQIGMIVIDATGQVNRFGHGELTLLETVASLIVQVLDNVRLYRSVLDERSTLNAILASAADPILLISPNNHLLLTNRAAERRLGIRAESGQPLATLISQPDLLHLLMTVEEIDGPAPPREVVLAQGETFSVSIAPVHGAEDELLGRVAVLQDITAIKELEHQEQERLRSVFRRYVSPPVVEQVLAGGGNFGAPIERDVVVLFADMRGYTTLTEGMDARILVDQVLNRYFTAMSEVLHSFQGTIDKFLGDGVIGVFGTPIARDDDVQRSLLAAVELQRAFALLQRTWCATFGLNIGMGIGMGYGSAVIGNIGSAQRLDYTLIGDVVNTASRLSGLAQPGQIVVSYRLVDALPREWSSPWSIRPLDRVMLKGKQEPHLIYEIEYLPSDGQGGARVSSPCSAGVE